MDKIIQGGFDIETTQPDCKGRVRVYCTSIYLETGVTLSFTKWRDFITWVFDETHKGNKYRLWVYNLSGFEKFFLQWTICSVLDGEQIESQTSCYSMAIKNVKFCEASTFFRVGEKLLDVAKAYNLQIQDKSLNTDGYERDFNHLCTAEEQADCEQDARLAYEVVISHKKLIGELLHTRVDLTPKLSNGSIVFNDYMESYEYMFDVPYTTSIDISDDMRKSYYGGYVYARVGKYGKVNSYDLVNAYPSTMSFNEYPQGAWTEIKAKDKDKYKYYIVECVITNAKVKPKHLPSLPSKSTSWGINNTVQMELLGEHTIWLCNIDLELFLQNYDYEIIEYSTCYACNGTTSDYFKEYYANMIEFGKELKVLEKQGDKSAKLKRNALKTILNSLYGKFGSNPEKVRYTYYLDEKYILKRKQIKEISNELTKYYLPIAIYVTAYIRKKISDTVLQDIGFENVVYIDTDSIKYQGELLQPSKNIGSDLGQFDYEYTTDRMSVWLPKKYVYSVGDKQVIKGVSKTVQDQIINEYGFEYAFNNMDNVSYHRLTKKKAVGGIYLEQQTVYYMKQPKVVPNKLIIQDYAEQLQELILQTKGKQIYKEICEWNTEVAKFLRYKRFKGGVLPDGAIYLLDKVLAYEYDDLDLEKDLTRLNKALKEVPKP